MSDTIMELVRKLRELASRVPSVASPFPLGQPTFGEGVGTEELESLRLPEGIPTDYREFLLTVGEIVAMDVHAGYHLVSPKLAVAMLCDTSTPSEIQNVPVLPIGSTGGGTLFVIECGGTGAVWRWTPFSPPTQLASTFTHFLARLAEDWKHFVDGDDDWAFLTS